MWREVTSLYFKWNYYAAKNQINANFATKNTIVDKGLFLTFT